MPRFQRLSKAELEVLEKKFIQFLAAQSIVSEDWVKIRDNDSERADQLIDDFSDVVYGSVMRDAKFLECRTRNALFCYKCLEDRFELVVFEIDKAHDLDSVNFGDAGQLQDLAPKIYRADKAYSQEKEDDVFELMKNGCVITDSKMFDFLSALSSN